MQRLHDLGHIYWEPGKGAKAPLRVLVNEYKIEVGELKGYTLRLSVGAGKNDPEHPTYTPTSEEGESVFLLPVGDRRVYEQFLRLRELGVDFRKMLREVQTAP
jgi:hypothetical protein